MRLIPALRAVHNAYYEQHDRHVDQHANDGGKRCARPEAEQADGSA